MFQGLVRKAGLTRWEIFETPHEEILTRCPVMKSIFFFLVSYVGERPWWPKKCLNKGSKKKAKG